VNLEVDMVAKHIERLLAMREGGADSEKLMSWLAESET
jgi:riboflavin synthase alpha subunit